MIYGIGINDMPRGWRLENELNERIYKCWHNMLRRCYSKESLDNRPTYKDCYVCDRWLLFSNFVKDISFIENYELWVLHPNERIALDKDIKSNGNKCYCLEQCMFTTIENNDRHSQTFKFKAVLQFDKNGNFIKKWTTIKDVEIELGIPNSNIVKCCKGKRKTAGGFIWKYA